MIRGYTGNHKYSRHEHKIKSFPTKHLCILVKAPFWHLICINLEQRCRFFLCYLGQICIKICAHIKNAEIAPSNDAIW